MVNSCSSEEHALRQTDTGGLTLQDSPVEGTHPAEYGLHSPNLGPAPAGLSLVELRDKCFHFAPMGVPIKEIKLIDDFLIFL